MWSTRLSALVLPTLLGVAFAAIAFGLWRSFGPPNRSVASQIKFEQVKYEMGQLRVGDSRSCEFNYTNNGPKPVMITAVNASCACAIAKLPEKATAPGESGSLAVTLNSTGKSAPSELKSKLMVYFQDAHKTEPPAPIELWVIANVCDDLRIRPRDLVFVDDGVGEPTLSLIVERDLLAAKAFAALRLRCPPCLEVTETERTDDKIAWQTKLLPTHVFSLINSIELEFGTEPNARKIMVPVTIVRTIRVVPELLFINVKKLDGSRLKESTRQMFQINSEKYAKMQVTQVKGDDQLIGRSIDGASFCLWLNAVPEQALYSSMLTVLYEAENGDQKISGELPLRARIWIQP